MLRLYTRVLHATPEALEIRVLMVSQGEQYHPTFSYLQALYIAVESPEF
jgi:hypothetical protein